MWSSSFFQALDFECKLCRYNAVLRALSPSKDVRTAAAPGGASRSSRTYSPALVRAFQPGSRFPLHFDSMRSYEWDTGKVGNCTS
jgi:hypothetical protein